MPELLGALGGVCRNFCGLRGASAGTFGGQQWGMLRGGYAGTVVRLGRVCRNFCGVRAGYAGTFVCPGGSMPELLWAQGGVCRSISGLGGGYTATFVGSQGGYEGTFGGS